MVGIKHESMRKGQTSHKKEHNTLKCFPLEPVFTRDKRRLPNFIDEPTTGLDVLAREDLLSMLREYMEENENRTILISSHISTDLEGLCDDLYMIDNGKVVLHEEIDTLLGQYGLLKISSEQYDTLDKNYLLRKKRESWGYACLTNQKQFYLENYPSYTMEKGSIDEVITMMIKGEKI